MTSHSQAIDFCVFNRKNLGFIHYLCANAYIETTTNQKIKSFTTIQNSIL